MVVSDKKIIRKRFGDRLRAEIDRLALELKDDPPPIQSRGRPQWLERKLKMVSATQCAKYLNGDDYPSMAVLEAMVLNVGLRWEALLPAWIPDFKLSPDQQLNEVARLWPYISPAARSHLLDGAKLAAHPPSNDQVRNPQLKSAKKRA